MMRSFFFLIIICCSQAHSQVEPYLMRHPVEFISYKPQELGSVVQRADILNSDGHLLERYPNLVSSLEQHSRWYISRQGRSSTQYYYRNERIRSEVIRYEGISMPTLCPSIFDLYFFATPIDRIQSFEVIYSPNIMSSLGSNSQIDISFPDRLTDFSPDGHVMKFAARIGQQEKMISLQGRFAGQKIEHYVGASLSQQLENDHKIFNFFDSLSNYQGHLFYELVSKLKEFSKLKWRTEAILTTNHDVGLVWEKDHRIQTSRQSRMENIGIRSILQYQAQATENKWYSGLQGSISYAYQPFKLLGKQERYTNEIDNHEQLLSLQMNGYKNHNARHVSYAGTQFTANILIQNIKTAPILRNQVNNPRILGSAYYNHEWRMSSDVSWLAGIHSRYEYVSLAHLNSRKHLPSFGAQISWTRHSCESSNYSISIHSEYRSPRQDELAPLSQIYSYLPNAMLRPEFNSQINVNLYKKINDRLEMDLSTFLSIKQNAIVERDQVLSPSDTNLYIQYQHIDKLRHAGVELSVKYHISKELLVSFYGQAQRTLNTVDSNIIPLYLPLSGVLRLQYRKDRSDIWISTQLQGNPSISSRLGHRYTRMYREGNTEGQVWSSYKLFNIYYQYRINSGLHVILRGDNLLNQNYQNYLSTVQGNLRNMSLELRWSF